MKTGYIPSIVLLLLTIIFSCKKTNQLPTCNITAPANGLEITRGDSLVISVDASDSDGSIIEVSFYINGVWVFSDTEAPYSYKWHSSSVGTGSQTLGATSTDNQDGSTSNQISVIVNNKNLIDPRDGKSYNIIDIGDQIWFAENLNFETLNSWYYNDNPANGDIYGRLYTWDAANEACPSGWHLPDDNEWKTLEMVLGMSQDEADQTGFRGTDEGTKLKNATGWLDNGNGSNIVGFSALPGGYGIIDSFNSGVWGTWWTSTMDVDSKWWYRSLRSNHNQVERTTQSNYFGFSVRCIKD
jgi:uncharacterized protein (TIGR02145 family)